MDINDEKLRNLKSSSLDEFKAEAAKHRAPFEKLMAEAKAADPVANILDAIEKYDSLRALAGDEYPDRHVDLPDMQPMFQRAIEREQRELEKLDMQRRATVASETALADANARAAAAEAEAKKQASYARAGLALGVAGFLAAIWPYIAARLEQ